MGIDFGFSSSFAVIQNRAFLASLEILKFISGLPEMQLALFNFTSTGFLSRRSLEMQFALFNFISTGFLRSLEMQCALLSSVLFFTGLETGGRHSDRNEKSGVMIGEQGVDSFLLWRSVRFKRTTGEFIGGTAQVFDDDVDAFSGKENDLLTL